MNIKRSLTDFAIAFTVTLAVAMVVTLVWNVAFHRTGTVDWETSFRFAIIFGITYGLLRPWMRAGESLASPKGE